MMGINLRIFVVLLWRVCCGPGMRPNYGDNCDPSVFAPGMYIPPTTADNATYSAPSVPTQTQPPPQSAQSAQPPQQPPYYAPPQQTSMVSPVYTQPPANRNFVGPCDDSKDSREKALYKNCIKNTLKNLRKMLENCKKMFGDDAPECCINEECLESLKSKKSKKRQADDAECKKGPLMDFLNYFKKEIEKLKAKNPPKSSSNYSSDSKRDCGSGKDPCD